MKMVSIKLNWWLPLMDACGQELTLILEVHLALVSGHTCTWFGHGAFLALFGGGGCRVRWVGSPLRFVSGAD